MSKKNLPVPYSSKYDYHLRCIKKGAKKLFPVFLFFGTVAAIVGCVFMFCWLINLTVQHSKIYFIPLAIFLFLNLIVIFYIVGRNDSDN